MFLLGDYAAPERRLIASIMNATIFDSLHSLPIKPTEKPIGTKYERKHKLNDPKFVHSYIPYLSYDARQFISDKNKLFCMYSWMLDIDPTYLSEKIWSRINLMDEIRMIIFYFIPFVFSLSKRKNGKMKLEWKVITKKNTDQLLLIYSLLCLRPLFGKIHKAEDDGYFNK